MLTDPIADFLIRIKNGYLGKKTEVSVPYSRLKEELAKILAEEGYLEKLKTQNSKLKTGKELVLTLKYEGKKPILTDVQRVSKPGLRIHVGKKKIPRVLGGLGDVIISTPKGLMTGKKAKEKGLGGEVICKIW